MVAAGIQIGPPDQLLICNDRNETQTACNIHPIRRSMHPRGAFFALLKIKRTGANCPKTIPACSFLYFLYIMMLGSKDILTPLIPDCYVLCTLAILKNIRNPLIFL